MKLLLVEWSDSHFARFGWVHRDNPEPLADSVTVGILLREDEKEIEIVPNLGRDFKSQGTTIPKGCIKRIRYLGVK